MGESLGVFSKFLLYFAGTPFFLYVETLLDLDD
jgi:hypothetical protein